MRIRDLINGLPVVAVEGSQDREISGLAYSSRDVQQGSLFIAMPGLRTDGHFFIGEAIRRGSVGILCERIPPVPEETRDRPTFVRVSNARSSFARIASAFYNYPARRLNITGITGTNGKTTTSFLIRKLLETKGKTGLIGTVGNWIGADREPSRHTTPESSDLQAIWERMIGAGVRSVVMEVSSHALALDRVVVTELDTAVFTNLTQDHLDFHGTMERYFEAKARMFNDPRLKDSGEKRGLALINRDDPWGEKLIHESLREVWTFGMKVGADFQATDVRIHAAGTDMTIRTPHGKLEIRSPLLGRFNVYNLLAAAGVAFANGVPAEEIEKTLGAPIQVPGRLERVAGNYPVTVLVDYAHTEDALLNILNTIRAISSGRIITVFGCGGERDRGKRPRMGYVAGTLSDRTILTSDNPRGEDPRSIIDEIEAGVRQAGSSRYRICPDRREAIREAISEAASGDCILIAGKGHESSQIIGAETLPFNDLEVAKEMMVARFGS